VDHTGVVPDILVVAKGIASGMPLGAMVAPARLMTWPPGAHGNTFGGNPLSCAAGIATLDVIQEQNLLQNAAQMGDRLMTGLSALSRKHDVIGHVRGVGLMVAFEVVADQESRAYAPELRDGVVDAAFDRNLLLLGAGKSAVRVVPPLNVEAADIDEVLDRLDQSLAAAGS
jgi:4-aminobutyrate aminotransferase